MKIGINLTRENVGGITSSSLNLINHLYRLDNEFLGIEITNKVHTKGPVLYRSFAPEIFDHHIINIHNLQIMDVVKRSRTLANVKKAYAKPIKIIRSILKDQRPNVILLSGTYYMPWLISIAAKAEGIPIVLWYAGILSKETEHYPGKAKKLFAAMERDIVSNASRIVFPSELCKRTVENMVLKKKAKKSYVIPNPVASIFTDPSAAESSVARRIAGVGRYSRIKNFDKFFALHKELLKRKWKHTASFVTNPNADLKKMPKTIELLPSMAPEGLKRFYLSQGLIVCPSLFETFGNVPMEAVCLGIPVLVSENMGCAEILKKVGLENMVMSFEDMSKVAERAQELCGQSILPKQLNALKRILDNSFVSEEIRAVLNEAGKKSYSKVAE